MGESQCCYSTPSVLNNVAIIEPIELYAAIVPDSGLPDEQEPTRRAVKKIHAENLKIVSHESKMGAALTSWEKGEEITSLTFSLHSSGKVFPSKLYALYTALLQVKFRPEPKVSILGDSKSSLKLLMHSKADHPLAKFIRENIREIRVGG
ncbi:hypothetical protein EVAR_84879_1 [Eumeta japonica]|uniref:RNase H type-1 domain-containing protein n=1 Tax=Eumeta variegata TaxID=151549 RepID=A0A4C1YJM1_EUMVA|nr:hypothetical protein EVAR_84879_1 [Eumeta japonica]